jgi:hypothetical protein
MDKNNDPISLNVTGPTQLVKSKINKIVGGVVDNKEGVTGEEMDELSLDLSDEELLLLARQKEIAYAPYESRIKPRQIANKQWYEGKQGVGTYVATNGTPIAANLLFESLETFLPAALAKNPEPVVYSDNSEKGNAISNNVKTMLQFHADSLAVRTKLKELTRSWAFNFLGAIKIGWDSSIQEIALEVVEPKNLIFDIPSRIDAYCDSTSEVVGERKQCSASKLIDLFPKHEKFITDEVEGKLGTLVTYTEWWSDDYCFYTFKGKILDKSKNPHFNYEKEGEKSINHFAKPKKPYVFLSVFSSSEQPHDITGLIEQNIPNQNRVTQREMQIDVNLNRSNNSIALNGLHYNEETAKQAAMAMQKGNPVLDPSGNPNEGIVRFPAPSVPDAVFKALETNKQDLRSSFGTLGITAEPANEDTTARGMILNQQYSSSRIGGGIGEGLEQVAKALFNWLVQMYAVYYTEQHFAAIMGQMKAVEYVILKNTDLDRQLLVSVAPDSMKPKDEITTMNQALELWEQKAIDIKTLLTILNFPDPQKTAAQAWLYQTNPQAYGQLNFPELQGQLAQLAGAPPSGAGGAPPPQEQGAQPGTLAEPPASAALSNVPIATNALPT